MTDIRGSGEFWDGWLSAQDKDNYEKLLNKAHAMGFRVATTIGGRWSEGSLTFNYDPKSDPVKLPLRIPFYDLDPSVVITKGGKLPCRGFYLPDVDHGAIAFLHEYSDWPYTAMRGIKLK